ASSTKRRRNVAEFSGVYCGWRADFSLDGAFFDLSTRVKLRVTGQDRHRYLNGQITNDLAKATEARAVEGCVLNAKGKMDAHVFVHADGESFLIDAEPEL